MLSKNSLIGLSILILNTSIFAQTNHNNRLKDVTANLREARTVVDIAISDDNLYIVNKNIGSTEQPLFEKTKAATNWSPKAIPANYLDDNSNISTIEADTDAFDEIFLLGTRGSEVRKFDNVNGWSQTSTSNPLKNNAEINLPSSFEVSAMTKYIDQSSQLTYTIMGLRNSSGGTLFKAEMNTDSDVNWSGLTIEIMEPFILPVTDIIVSEHNTQIIYVAVNTGYGDLNITENTVEHFYPTTPSQSGIANLGANDLVNGIWWSIDGGDTFNKLTIDAGSSSSNYVPKEQYFITKLGYMSPNVHLNPDPITCDKETIFGIYNVPLVLPTSGSPTGFSKPFLTSEYNTDPNVASGCGVLAQNIDIQSTSKDAYATDYSYKEIGANYLTDLTLIYDDVEDLPTTPDRLQVLISDYGNGLFSLRIGYNDFYDCSSSPSPPLNFSSAGSDWTSLDNGKFYVNSVLHNPEHGLYVIKSEFGKEVDGQGQIVNLPQTKIYSGGYSSFNFITNPGSDVSQG